MNLKVLITIILKILGVYVGIQAIDRFLQLITFLLISTGRDNSFDICATLPYVLSLIIYICIALLLILKTEHIANLIAKDEFYAIEFSSFKIHRSSVLTIGIIVIGGLLLVEELPKFIIALYNYLAITNNIKNIYLGIKFPTLLLSLVKIFIAIFLLYSNRIVLNWIERKRKNNAK